MSKLLDKLLSTGSIEASTLAESAFFNSRDIIPTPLPILNVAFSGRLDGGFTTGLTVFAGESKSFKTLLALYCLKAYFDKYPDAIAIFYDTEFGTTPGYVKSFGIDTNRVIHIPVEHVEQLKFDIVKKLESIERGDRVFLLVDSLGSLASKKEVEDAQEEKSVADMSRAKAIRSLFRIITPHLTMKDLPCIVINHIYKEIGLFPKNIVGGGTSVMYSANQIFIITKAQEKDKAGDIAGYKFTINVEKSRFVREKSKLPFSVSYDKGIEKYSGLWDLAVEANIIKEVSKGWYSVLDGDKQRASTIENDVEFWKALIDNESFREFVSDQYQLKMEPMEIDASE